MRWGPSRMGNHTCPHCQGALLVSTCVVAATEAPKRSRKTKDGATLLRELATNPMPCGGELCCTPDDAYRILRPMMEGLRKEHFVAIYLDGRRRVAHVETISVGTLTSTLVHPREVFLPAIACSAASIIVAHNHPSGDPNPSPEDLALTRRLRDAGRLLGIELVDHIIVGKPAPHRASFVSLKQMGDL